MGIDGYQELECLMVLVFRVQVLLVRSPGVSQNISVRFMIVMAVGNSENASMFLLLVLTTVYLDLATETILEVHGT